MTNTQENQSDTIRGAVREGYGNIAKTGGGGGGCGCNTSCCGTETDQRFTERLGYDAEQLDQLPDGADMGLSCGNPTALASLKEGETVLDLGSGGGLDTYLAGLNVGPTGRAIGVDMTAQMLDRARGGIESYRQRSGLDNVEFRLGEIEHLPIADRTIDVILSNCVINLSPDKPQVWREITRVLKPGGRIIISDLALHQPLPENVADMIESWIGCIAGASLIEDIRTMTTEAGLTDIQLDIRSQYVEALENVQDDLYLQIMERLPEGTGLSDYVANVIITAIRPV